MVGCGVANAQTQVDLRTQSKAVDFQSAVSTRPLKTGAVLPAACSVGEMFFLTVAAAGQNLYGCAGTNTWTLQSGSGGGAMTIQNAGIPVGARSIMDLTTGAGILMAISDTGQAITVQTSADGSVVQTLAGAQAGGAVYCVSASGSGSSYSCGLAPVLTSYTTGMELQWRPDVNGTGGATTLNIDTLGAVPVKLSDGSHDPAAGDLVAGNLYTLWFDGSAFRWMEHAQISGIFGQTQPSCTVQTGGRLWFTVGGTGVKDSLEVCAKDAAAVYAWRGLY
jgi:hypothetical protein